MGENFQKSELPTFMHFFRVKEAINHMWKGIWHLQSAKWMKKRALQHFGLQDKVPQIGIEAGDYRSPSKKGGPMVSLAQLDKILS